MLLFKIKIHNKKSHLNDRRVGSSRESSADVEQRHAAVAGGRREGEKRARERNSARVHGRLASARPHVERHADHLGTVAFIRPFHTTTKTY